MSTLKRFFYFLSFSALLACNTDEELPVTSWNKNTNLPLVFYLSGDGGFNTFSTSFAIELHHHGYDVFALDSKKYFWKKKTPLQASQDVEKYLKNLISDRENKKIILVGYSYGADVTSFIYNRFDADFKNHIQSITLIGPSQVNDFEIHLEEYISGGQEYGYSVPAEINRVKGLPLTIVLSDFEMKYFPIDQITTPSKIVHLPGNHKFNGKTKILADNVLQYF